jgi:hypothetical protein
MKNRSFTNTFHEKVHGGVGKVDDRYWYWMFCSFLYLWSHLEKHISISSWYNRLGVLDGSLQMVPCSVCIVLHGARKC